MFYKSTRQPLRDKFRLQGTRIRQKWKLEWSWKIHERLLQERPVPAHPSPINGTGKEEGGVCLDGFPTDLGRRGAEVRD